MKKETIISIALVTFSVIVIIIGGVVINGNGNWFSSKNEKKYSIKLIDEKITLSLGEEYDFNADIESFSGTGLVFSSSKPEIVKIDKDTGIINALALGEATITVSFSNDSSISKSCLIEVVESSSGDKVKLKKIYFDRDTYNLYVGDTTSLNVLFDPTNTTDKGLTWTSSNTKVVTINSGMAKGINAGEATITVKSHDGGFEAKTKVIVKELDEKVEVSSISLNTNNLDLDIGESIKLNVTFNPSNAYNKKVTWVSNNPGVANVSSDGVIMAIKEGNAIITAKTSNGKTANCKVLVTKKDTIIEVDEINITNEVLSLDLNNSLMLEVTISPPNATNKSVTWSSSDSKIVSVNENGVVTGKQVGTAVITAKSSNGKESTCTVTVTKETIPVNSITVDATILKLEVGKTATINASILPRNATNQTVTWESNNPAVATVKNGVVTAVSKGSATITAFSNNGKKASCKVEVSDGSDIEVESIKLTENEKTIDINKSYVLFFTLTPSNATNRTVTWTSSDPSVVKVANGVITGLKEGNAIIYATTANGKVDTCNVTVEDNNIPVESISLNQTDVTLNVAGTTTLRVVFNPVNATDKTIKWSSSDPSVATVSVKGVVTAVSKGSATITAKSNNGKVDIARITVNE